MVDKVLKVLYIAGSGRSGSTILGNILGQAQEWVFGGELHQIWYRGFLLNYQCTCGLPFRECPYWQAVLDEAFGGYSAINPKVMLQASSMLRSRDLFFKPAASSVFSSEYQNYLQVLGQLYQSIQSVTPAAVIVDSSKFHTYAYALQMLPNIQLYVLHLVRDPRGVAYSWQKRQLNQGAPGQKYMQRFTIWQSTYLWLMRNWFTVYLFKSQNVHYRVLRYEDFVGNPQQEVKAIWEWVDPNQVNDLFIDENKVQMGLQHVFSGNPARFSIGKVIHIKPDDNWRTLLSKRWQRAIKLIAWPQMLKYGYW